MLPILSLDDERFEEIIENARKMIPNLSPEWTDFNYHDPGVTIIELLAWLKEIQQFHMDQIGPLHIRKYFMLLGEKTSGPIPAKVRISLSGAGQEIVLPRGSRFYASDVEFESTHSHYLQTAGIVKLLTTAAGGREDKNNGIEVGNGLVHFYVFGPSPRGGEEFYIGLSAPLLKGRTNRLYLGFYDGYPVRRNPVEGAPSFVPLAEIRMEALCGGGFIPVEDWSDDTSQLLESGAISFTVPEKMESGEDGLFWLRLALLKTEYDVPPLLEYISLNEVAALQRRTLSEYREIEAGPGKRVELQSGSWLAMTGSFEIYRREGDIFRRYDGPSERRSEGELTKFILPELSLRADEKLLLLCFEEDFSSGRLVGTGTGFPCQEYETEISWLCAEGMVLLVETEEGSESYMRWERVEDFTGSGPADRHFLYDEKKGALIFGDCDRGMAPEGRIILAAGHTCKGRGGNVKADTVKRYEGPWRLEQISNSADALGGKDRETEEDCLWRLHRRLKAAERAVTYEDYEDLVKRTPGLRIENVKAIPVTERKRRDGTMDENRVTLVVKPYSEIPMPKLGRAYLEGILNMLEPRRMIGSKVSILSPEYIGITLFMEIETDFYYRQVREEVGEAVKRYFQEQSGQFGQPVLYGTIYGIIDVLEHVTGIQSVSLDAQGSGIRRNRNGDILLPANGLPYLKEWDCTISSAG